MAPAFERREHHEEIGRAVALVFIIEPDGRPLHPDLSARFGNQLLRGLSRANQRNIGIAGRYRRPARPPWRLRMHCWTRRMTHCCFRCGLENVFLRVRPIVLHWRDRRCSTPRPCSPTAAIPARGPWRFGTSQGDQLGFLLAIKSGNGRRSAWLAAQHGLEAFFHQLLAHA